MDTYFLLISTGVQRVNLKDYIGAIMLFDKAIILRPDFIEAYFERAKSKIFIKDYYGALKDYESVLELGYSSDPSVYNNMGIVKIELSDLEGAFKCFKTALSLDPSNSDAKENLRRLEMDIRNNINKINNSPQTITAILEVAEFKTHTGDYNGALIEYNNLVSIANDDPLSYECRASFKLNYLKDYAGAIKDYDKSIEIYPSTEAIISRAEAKIEINDLNGANQDFFKVLEQKPEKDLRIKILSKIAEVGIKLKNFKLAIACYDRLIQLDPSNVQFFLARAPLLYNTDNISAAIKDWEKVVQLQPNNVIASNNLQTAKVHLKSVEDFTLNMLNKVNPKS